MKHEIPQMLKNGGGAIVNTSSVYGIIGHPQLPIYAASKHAILGLTRSAALEYAKAGIRINAVAAGAIETEMMEQSIGNDKQLRQALVEMHLLVVLVRLKRLQMPLFGFCLTRHLSSRVIHY